VEKVVKWLCEWSDEGTHLKKISPQLKIFVKGFQNLFAATDGLD